MGTKIVIKNSNVSGLDLNNDEDKPVNVRTQLTTAITEKVMEAIEQLLDFGENE